MSRNGAPRLAHSPETDLQQLQEGPRVLIVDDEPVVGEICSRALTDCRVDRAENGRQALDLLAKTEFDLVLTDVNMPDMDGLDLLRSIKSKRPDQVVILMTGYACKETILEALKADADDFINKPLNLLHLQTLVNKTLEKKELKEELRQLKRLDSIKTEFLGMVSDKLNNPVTAISLFFQNINHDSINLDDPSFHNQLDLIRAESNNLVDLIQSLLFYSQLTLDESPLKTAPTPIGRLLREAIADTERLCGQKNLSLATDLPEEPPTIPVDRIRIRFVIRAVLENAIHACEPGDSIHIGVTTDSTETALTITDPGKGIPLAKQEKVFDKFYQVGSSSQHRSKGFGLGLYYARHFTRMHQGRLTLKSAPGCGTSVTLTLPN